MRWYMETYRTVLMRNLHKRNETREGASGPTSASSPPPLLFGGTSSTPHRPALTVRSACSAKPLQVSTDQTTKEGIRATYGNWPMTFPAGKYSHTMNFAFCNDDTHSATQSVRSVLQRQKQNDSLRIAGGICPRTPEGHSRAAWWPSTRPA